MSFTFKPAKREGTFTIIGLMGPTGSGKTWTALEIATGLAGGERFAVIDTEAGKAQHYADDFDFDHGDLMPPFNPGRYQEAIAAAEKYPVVVVDSFSHEHAGEGGLLDMHDTAVQGMIANAERKGWKANPEKYSWPAWSKPKQEHSRMISRLLQMRSHLIFCFRAERKTKSVKVKGKNGGFYNEVVDAGWKAICAKGIEFETTVSFMLVNSETSDTRGWVRVGGSLGPGEEEIGYPLRMSKPLEHIFSGKHRLSRAHGAAVAEWAAGDKATEPKPKATDHDQDKLSAKAVEGVRKRYFDWGERQAEGSAYPATIADALEQFGFDGGVEDMTVENGQAFASWLTATGKRCRDV